MFKTSIKSLFYLEKPWRIRDIHQWRPTTVRFGSPSRFLRPERVLARNISLASRIYRAWLVFTCKADCFIWEDSK